MSRPAELRIDVDPPLATLDDELAAIHERLYTPGDCLHDIARIPLLADPDLVARYRQADGEFYLYIEDVRRRRLAGYTVFNRLVELNRHADRHLRAPHSKYAAAYQRRGLATAVYRWALEGGMGLITGARQSQGAHALWERLAREHLSGYVRLQGKALAYLGPHVPPQVLDDLHARRFLLGPRWTLARLQAATGMEMG
ncbi:MAG: N-acetyltransferase [Comamonadaceae bacterium]|nr:MAG: N-acetyltransferase [Comamonadaceae bacterium]